MTAFDTDSNICFAIRGTTAWLQKHNLVAEYEADLVAEPEEGEEEEEDGYSEGDGAEKEGDEDEEDESESGEESSGYDSEEEARIKRELEDIPFEVLERLRESGQGEGSVGAAATKGRASRKREGDTGAEEQASRKRANKNRPQEISSKRPVPRFREVFQASKREVRDPRFESLCGSYSQDAFRKRYKFIYDEQLPEEATRLKSLMNREKNPAKKKKLQAKMTRVQQKLVEEKSIRKKETWEREQKSKERELVKAGKKPFFQKRSDKRKAELVAKYQQLKESGQLDKFMAKKRRHNAAKDHRLIPSARRGAN
uniref:rRNA biogenesis protein RRP36 n=1 Tax=Tetraselmis chuii TaxID=63592 RepID=A0A7S1T2J7_9CHLO